MTSPLATASTNVYTVEFDGFEVRIRGKMRQKVLRVIPLAELVAVEYKPSTGIAGGRLRFRVAGTPSKRDVIVFNGGQQPGMEALAAAIQRYHRPPVQLAANGPAADPWLDHPVPPSQRVVTRTSYEPGNERLMRRALTLTVWLESFSLVILLVPIVLGILACAGAFIFLR